jgi:hypothetical protein
MLTLRRALVVPAALVVLAATAAQAQVKLQFKFPENQEYRTHQTLLIDQVLTVNGMEVPTKSEQTIDSKRVIGAKRADGSIPVVETIESVKSQIELPGGVNLTFDSDAKGDEGGDEPPPLKQARQIVRALGGASYTVVMDKDGKVAAIEGAERAVPKADTLDPGTADQIKKRFNAERLKKESVEEFSLFPDILLRQGEPWERTETMDIGSGQTLTFQRKYEYQGTVDKDGRTLDKIGVKATTVSYAMDPSPETPVAVPKSDLKIDSSDGTILFDRELGRIVESKSKTRITGDMTLSIMGNDLESKLDLTLDSESTLEQPKK